MSEVQKPLLNPRLCARCQGWNEMDRLGTISSTLTLEELSQNSTCLMCQFAVSKVKLCLEGAGWNEVLAADVTVSEKGPFLMEGGDMVEYCKASPASSTTTAQMFIWFHIEATSTACEAPGITSALILQCQVTLSYSTGDPPQLLSIIPWDKPTFDLGLMRQWLDGCELLHGPACCSVSNAITNDLPVGFRVIDVQRMCVVKPIESVSYAALSYMWPLGKDNDIMLESRTLSDLEITGSLDKVPLPRLIQDAIRLCRELNGRFLWVDRLCIIQDDLVDKQNQIGAMDKVYRSATCTLVAALNVRDGSGLPGFGINHRKDFSWTDARNADIRSIRTRPNGMSALVNISVWNTRGWTFQERILSKRRLFITDSQVIFECSKGQAYEELLKSSHGSPYVSDFEENDESAREQQLIPGFQPLSPYGRDTKVDYNLRDNVTLIEYLNWIQDYTSRQLTNCNDILHAFAGIGNYLSSSLQTNFIFGLPERYLPHTLMWHHDNSTSVDQNSQHIPRWSWASVQGRIDYRWIEGRSSFHEDMLKIISLVYFHLQDPIHGLQKLPVQEQWLLHELPMSAMEDNDDIMTLTRKYIPSLTRTKLTWRGCPQNPWTAHDRQKLDPQALHTALSHPGSLVFNTTVARMKLAHDTRDIYKNATTSNRDVSLRTSTGQHIGWLNKMSSEWIIEHVGTEDMYEVIVICGALADWRSRKTLVQYCGVFDLWRLHVMLVERVDEGRESGAFRVRRCGVGIVEAHLWKDCDVRWETVVLV